MSNGSDEIAEIRKRLEAIERAIDALRAGNLVIMKTMATELSEMYYNIFILSQKSEDMKKYTELWARKLADIRRIIQGAETSEAATETGDKSVKEITAHAKPENVDSATKAVEKVDDALDAMDIANAFMKKDNPVALPLTAVRRDDIWLVDVDIGAVRMEIVRVKIDARTGNILGHEVVERK
jgi:beta-galactosidase beta subunit